MIRMLMASVFLVVGFSAARAVTIRDGSFENPVVPEGQTQAFSKREKFGGWHVVGESGNILLVGLGFSINGVPFPAQKGNQWVCLTGNTRTQTGVQKKIATTAGQKYELRFFVGNINDPAHGLGSQSTVRVFINSVFAGDAVNSNGDATHFVWKKAVLQFTATSDETTIAFINEDDDTDNINGLDHISLFTLP